jgi:hypothetical protein
VLNQSLACPPNGLEQAKVHVGESFYVLAAPGRVV